MVEGKKAKKLPHALKFVVVVREFLLQLFVVEGKKAKKLPHVLKFVLVAK